MAIYRPPIERGSADEAGDIPPPPAKEPLTVPVEEAARLLGISRKLAYELVRVGDIPSLRLGRRIVVPTTGLMRLVERASNGVTI